MMEHATLLDGITMALGLWMVHETSVSVIGTVGGTLDGLAVGVYAWATGDFDALARAGHLDGGFAEVFEE